MVESEDLKTRKDALISALCTLAKAAQDSANATIDFYNALEGDASFETSSLSKISQALANLDSLKSLAANGTATAAVPNKDIKKGVAAKPTKKSGAEVSVAAVATSAPAQTSADESEILADSVDNTKKKRVKKEKDPNAPKKPMTSYLAFANAMRQQIKQEYEKQGLAPVENINLEISNRWKGLSVEERKPFQDQYDEALKAYNQQKFEYEQQKGAGAVNTPSKREIKSVAVVSSPALSEPSMISAAEELLPETTELTDASPKKRKSKEGKEKRKKEKKKKVEA